ncbi:MAG: hypothetical protein FWG40_11620 [Peptococcaceae bacterium]|nr:hypothetical protein [Peptococcaceae bacterium]
MEWEQARRDLEEILSADEYAGFENGFVSFGQSSSPQAPPLETATPVELPAWLNQFLQWLEDFFSKLFPDIPMQGPFWIAILAIFVALFAVFIVWLIRRLRRDAHLRKKSPGETSVKDKTYDECFSEADDWASRRDYAQAIRFLFLAFIVFLSQKGWIQLRSWKTNGQYLRELRACREQIGQDGNDNHPEKDASSLYREFSLVAGSFEDVFYGGYPPTSEMYTLCRDRAVAWIGKEAAS